MHLRDLRARALRACVPPRRIFETCTLLLATAALVACGDNPIEPHGEIVRIAVAGTDYGRAAAAGTIEPATAVVEIGSTVQLVALDPSGSEVRAQWSSSATSVAAISPTGLVTGRAEGVATITSTTGGKRGSATATVQVVPALPPTAPATCAGLPRLRTVRVATASALEAALGQAEPGDLIELAPGTYTGYFKASRSGTADRRIALCGPRDAVLQTGVIDRGHALWLDGASHWTLQGFTAGSSLGGISITGGAHNHIVGLLVRDTGLHGIRIGIHSSHTVVRDSEIRETGRVNPEFGEGIYVGSWSGSWCARTACQPDRSDSTLVLDNRIGPNVTAEHVQVMEGTTGGIIRGNVFDGRGMGAPGAPAVDSWVAVMGNGYLVEENRGTTSLRNGFEVWVEIAGWGRDNVLRRNVADVRADGYGFHVSPSASGTTVACDNVVLDARAGFSNAACR